MVHCHSYFILILFTVVTILLLIYPLDFVLSTQASPESVGTWTSFFPTDKEKFPVVICFFLSTATMDSLSHQLIFSNNAVLVRWGWGPRD